MGDMGLESAMRPNGRASAGSYYPGKTEKFPTTLSDVAMQLS